MYVCKIMKNVVIKKNMTMFLLINHLSDQCSKIPRTMCFVKRSHCICFMSCIIFHNVSLLRFHLTFTCCNLFIKNITLK